MFSNSKCLLYHFYNYYFITYLLSGACECNNGFGGVDCSIDMNGPPMVTLNSVNECDNKYSNCSGTTILVYGNNFIEEKIKCSLTEIEVSKIFIS